MIDTKTKEILKLLTVLYVEDEQDIRTQMADVFERKFGKTLLAENGKQGLEIYHQHKPDLIITDVKMPIMTGLEMIAEIRKEDGETPVIVITAYSDIDNMRSAIDLNVDRFLAKPPKKQDLDLALVKVTSAIVKQRQIDDRDEIIRAITGWHPYFSIICHNNGIKFVSSDLLGCCGEAEDETIAQLQQLYKLNDDGTLQQLTKFSTTEELVVYLVQHTTEEMNHFVQLLNRHNDKCTLFGVRARYFDSTQLYLVSLFTTDITLK